MEIVGDEGVRLFAVGKKEVRNREGRRGGHWLEKQEEKTTEGIKDISEGRISHDITSEMKSSLGLRPCFLVMRRQGMRG